MRRISSSDIREFRIRNNLSQQDLAGILGVSWVSVHRWETGKSQPSKLSLKHLSRIISGWGWELVEGEPNQKLYLNLQEARRKLDRGLTINYEVSDASDIREDPFYRIRAHKLNIKGDLSSNPDDFLYGGGSS